MTAVTKSDQQLQIGTDEYLRAMYEVAYGELAKYVTLRSGPLVEIGAGPGLARTLGHKWWRSDISTDCAQDLYASALALPHPANSLAGLILKDAWHHIPDIEAFLIEAHRVLMPNGNVVVFDPYWGALARFVYRFLHQERWDSTTPHWNFDSRDPWDSNQALSFIMLRRDRLKFEQQWGDRFTIIEHAPVIGPSFLLSGGVSRRTAVPGSLLKRLLDWEQRQGAWLNHLRFFHVFSLRKKAT